MNKFKNKTIDDFLSADIRTLKVFKRFRVPFNTSHFHNSLEELCKERGINVEKLWEALDQVLKDYDQPVHDYNNWELNFLIDYIINTHHRYNKTTLSILVNYALKIEKETDIKPTSDMSVSEYCILLQELLTSHMEKEEKILFPYINALENNANDKGIQEKNIKGLKKSIAVLVQEHNEIHKVLQNLEKLISANHEQCKDSTNCNSLIYKLKEFKDDLIIHHHIENNILFKKALQIEKQTYN